MSIRPLLADGEARNRTLFIDREALNLASLEEELLAIKECRDALQASNDDLERRNAALEDAMRQHAELTAFALHDLKSPLAVVYMTLGWLSRNLSTLDTRATEYLADAMRGATRLRSMVSDLLVISRLDQPSFVVHREPFDVGPLLNSVLKSFRGRAEEAEIHLTSPAEGAELLIDADRAILQRVFENILDNALRYTPRGGRIAVGARRSAGIEIVFSNDGPPIRPADRLSIFERYNRCGTGAGEHGNAGLGLTFCKRAIEAHGGHIAVIETHEWPTSFLIVLPA
jgi:signal transduction histidine kinase